MIGTYICFSHDSVSQNLEIRQAATKFDIDLLRSALNDKHCLKAGRPAGNTIWQGIYWFMDPFLTGDATKAQEVLFRNSF